MVCGPVFLDTGNRNPRTGKQVFALKDPQWLPAENLLRHALVVHNCDGRCGIRRFCSLHSQGCPESCSFSRVAFFHQPDKLFSLDSTFRDLAS